MANCNSEIANGKLGRLLTVIYLNNNATTSLASEVLKAMSAPVADKDETIRRARESVAVLLGANDPQEVFFTSGGTESNSLAILEALKIDPQKSHVITTRVEHETITTLCKDLEQTGNRVTWLNINEKGTLDMDQLRDSLDEDTAVISIMMANHETGVIFPVADIAQIVKEHSNALFHVDGACAAGKVAINLKNTAIDLFSISAHKFHGPKGIGALYVRNGVNLPSISSREMNENFRDITGLGTAAELAGDLSAMEHIRALRTRMETAILSSIPNTSLNGTVDELSRLPNTSNISFENTNGEMILSRLDDEGICVSTRSACNSETRSVSPVLQAMNIPYSKAMGSISFSLGRENTDAEIDVVIEKLPLIITEIKNFDR
ncbi:MAG TPA: aminotransferase class V-fold PLP-dependent enzyme [Pyrinomonadaceae bacterium]|nr:aminotransferase class V-fold PLP-dependent enzyme [Pyrinomonadaceae bacterium]